MYPLVGDNLASMAVMGPMARYVSDLKLMFKSMVPEDKLVKLKMDQPVDLRQIKILYMTDDGGNPMTEPASPPVKQAMDRAMSHFKETYGVTIEQVSFRRLLFSLPIWSANLKESDPRNMVDVISGKEGQGFSILLELLKSMIGLSTYSFNILFMALTDNLLGLKRGSVQSLKFIEMGNQLRQEFLKSLGGNGVFFYPTLPEVAPKHNTTIFKAMNCGYCGIINIMGFPSTHCPMGLSPEGLPVGFQVISRPFNDRLTLSVAEELEKNFGGWTPPFPV
jgi:fatty acid amide hydrolase 2